MCVCTCVCMWYAYIYTYTRIYTHICMDLYIHKNILPLLFFFLPRGATPSFAF